MGRLWNKEKGGWETVPDDQVHDMIMSKKWAPHAGLGLHVVMPNGDPGQIEGAHYEYWASKGARFETDRERDKRRLSKAVRETPFFGGTPVAAFLAGTGKGATVSATDLLSRASEREALSDEHPISSALGELTGIIATLPFTAATTGAAGTAAQLSRIARIGRWLPGSVLSRKATALAGGAVAGAVGTGLAETLVGRAVATSIASSLESVAYTAPGELAGWHEDRPGYTADAIVGKLTTSALWGGAWGFGLPLGIGAGVGITKGGVRAGGFAMQSTYRMLTGNPISRAAGRMFLNNAVRWKDLDPNQAASALSMTLPDLKARSRTIIDATEIVTDQRHIQKTQKAELILSNQELLLAKKEAKVQELVAQKTAAKYESAAEAGEDIAERELRRIQRTGVGPAKKQLEAVEAAEEGRLWEKKAADVEGRVAAQERSIAQSADDIAAKKQYELAQDELVQAKAALDAQGLIDDAAPIAKAPELTAEAAAKADDSAEMAMVRYQRALAAVEEAEPAARAAEHSGKLADMGHEARRLELALDGEIGAARKEYDRVAGETAEIKKKLADDLWELEEKISKELKPLRGLEGKPGPGGRNSVEFDTNPKNIVNAPDDVKASVAFRAAEAAEESEALVEEFWDFWGSPQKKKLVVAALEKSPPATPGHEIAEHTLGLLTKTSAALGESTVEVAGIADSLLGPFRTSALEHVNIALQAVTKANPGHTGGKPPSVEQVAEVHMAINKLKRYLNNDLFKHVDRADPVLEAAGFFKQHAHNLNTFLTNAHYWGETLSGIQRLVNKASERVLNNTHFFKSTFLKETGRRKVLVDGVEKTRAELIGKGAAFSNYIGSYLTPANGAPQRVLVERITALDDLAAAVMSAEKITKTVGKGKGLAKVSGKLRQFHEVEAKAFHDANEMLRLTIGDLSHGVPSQSAIPGLEKSVFMQAKARHAGLEEAKAALLHTQKEQARVSAELTRGPKAKLDKLKNLKESTSLEKKGRELTEAISTKERLLAEEAMTLQHSTALRQAKETLTHWEDSYTTAKESLAAFRKEVLAQGKGAKGERLAAKNAAAEKEIEIMEKIAQAEEKIRHSQRIIDAAEQSKRMVGKTEKELKASNTGLGTLVEAGVLGSLAYGGSPLLGVAVSGTIHAFRRPAHFAQMTANLYHSVSQTYKSINTRLDEIVGRIAKGAQRAVREGKQDYLATFASHVGVGLPHSMELPLPIEVKAKTAPGGGYELGPGERRERAYE